MKFVIPMAFSDPLHFLEMARTAEEAGWDCMAVSDHVVYPETLRTPYPYTPDGKPRFSADTPWPDPWVSIGAMAAVTRRLSFLTNVFVLPMRHPLAVAKAVGTAAVLSGGRVTLGIGMGWMREEFELLGQEFRQRGLRADEMVEILRKVWSGGMVEHQGRFYTFERLRMDPAPPGPIKLYVGGFSEPALRRVARLADGWISELHTVEELGEIIGRIRRYRREAGRGDAPLDVVGSATDAFGLDGYRRMEDAGVTHIMVMPWLFYRGSTDSLEDKCAGMRRFADEVIAKLR